MGKGIINFDVEKTNELLAYVAQIKEDGINIDAPKDGNLYGQKDGEWEQAQEQLESGKNIKTLNGVSVLGEGNIDIAPTIGENGNWYINGLDTGKPAKGNDGADGVSLGEIALVQETGTGSGSENKVMSQAAVTKGFNGIDEKINNRTTEYNVSVNHPTSGTDGTNRYDLAGAIAQVPAELRTAGLTVSFLNADGNTEKWEFSGVSWAVGSFEQVGAVKLTELDKYLNKTACKTLFRNCYINVKDDSLNIIISAGNNSASCSNLLVYPKKDIICKNVSNNTNPGYANVPAVIFFDKEFNYLGCVFHSSNDDLILESSIVPEGTVFFAIQSRGSVNFQTFDCEEFIGVYDTGINIKVLEVIKELKSTTTNTATSLNSFSERILNLYSYCFKSKDLSIINLKSGVFIDKKTGTESGYGNAKVTDFISIDGKSSVKYTGSYGSNSCIAAFYNKDKKFISSIGDSDVIEKVTDYQVNLKGTEEAVYVRFSSLADEFKVLLEGADDTYIDITEINNKILDIDSKLKTATEDIDSKLETATEEINDIKENSRIKLEYAVSNIELPSNKESGFFGMIFDKEIRITSLTYMSQTIKTDNKIVVCGKEEVGDSGNTVTVKTIIPINDSQVGENTVSDLNITVEEGWSLFILGNDLFVNKGNIQEVRSSILAPGVVNAKVGDKVYYGQKLQVQKSVGITGILINVITEEYLSNLIKKYISESETSILNKTNYLNGKILCVTGDSEAAGHSIGKPASYGALIASRNNMTVYNTAENGRKMAFVEDSPGSGTPLVKAIDEIREDADYILCHIGYNDAFDESEEDDSKDITKYKGAFNTVIEGWQSRCPMARIGIIIPYYFGREETRIKRAEWMKKRCEYYHIQYIDGTIKSGLNYNSAEQKEIYFIDGVHLTRLGHEKVSYLYEQFLREL